MPPSTWVHAQRHRNPLGNQFVCDLGIPDYAQLQGTILYRGISECECRISETRIWICHPALDHPQ